MILGFKAAFVPHIVANIKVHTIRQGSRWKVGQMIHFYSQVRQPGMHKFRPDAVVLAIQEVEIADYQRVFVDGRQLVGEELLKFAVRDGFGSVALLCKFFSANHELPFKGQLIHWTDLTY